MQQYAQITTKDLLALGVAIYGDKLPAWYRAFSITASYAKTADRLQDKDIEAVAYYLQSNSHYYELEEIKTVRISVKELTELLPCSKSTASKAIEHCINAGLLEMVKAGTRGTSTLYVFLPPWKNKNTYTSYEGQSIPNRFGNYEETTEPIIPNRFGNYEEKSEPINTNNINRFGTYEGKGEPINSNERINHQMGSKNSPIGSVNHQIGSINTPNRFGNYEGKGELSILSITNPYYPKSGSEPKKEKEENAIYWQGRKVKLLDGNGTGVLCPKCKEKGKDNYINIQIDYGTYHCIEHHEFLEYEINELRQGKEKSSNIT